MYDLRQLVVTRYAILDISENSGVTTFTVKNADGVAEINIPTPFVGAVCPIKSELENKNILEICEGESFKIPIFKTFSQEAFDHAKSGEGIVGMTSDT